VAGRIDEFYGRAVYAPRGYDERIGTVFDRIRAKYGFTVDHRDRRERARVATPAIAPGAQLALGVR
jgi:hypothetical protein